MSSDLSDSQRAEGERKDHPVLTAAQKVEVASLTASIQAQLTRQGDLSVEVEKMKDDLAETQKSSVADQLLAAKLAESCTSQLSEWDERQKNSASELVPIHVTTRVLSDDDALDFVKATVPSPSLM